MFRTQPPAIVDYSGVFRDRFCKGCFCPCLHEYRAIAGRLQRKTKNVQDRVNGRRRGFGATLPLLHGSLRRTSGRSRAQSFGGKGKTKSTILMFAYLSGVCFPEKHISAQKSVNSSPPYRKIEASFVEPMECLSVSKLPEGLQWIWRILCGWPHSAEHF